MQWANTDLQNCLCWDSNKESWCDSVDKQCEDYYRHLAPAAGLGLVFIALGLLFVFVYYIIRAMAFCKTLTCCLICRRLPCTTDREHTSRSGPYVYRSLVALAFVGLCCGASWFSWGPQSDVYDGLKSLNQTMTAGTEDMTARTTVFIETSRDLQLKLGLEPDHYSTHLMQDVSSKVSSWTSGINSTQVQVLRYQWATILLAWGAPLVTLALLVVTCLNVHRIVPEIVVFFMAFLTLAVFCLQVVIGLMAAANSDLCDDYNKVTAQMEKVVESKVGCDKFGRLGGIIDANELFISTYAKQVSQDNSTLEQACGEFFDCKGLENLSQDSSLSEVAAVVHQSRISEDDGSCVGSKGCGIEGCVTLCANGSEQQMLASEIYSLLQGVQNDTTIIENVSYPLAMCQPYFDMMNNAYPAFCYTPSSGLQDSFKQWNKACIMCVLFAGMALFLSFFANCIYTSHGAPEQVAKYLPADFDESPPMGQPVYLAYPNCYPAYPEPPVLPVPADCQDVSASCCIKMEETETETETKKPEESTRPPSWVSKASNSSSEASQKIGTAGASSVSYGTIQKNNDSN